MQNAKCRMQNAECRTGGNFKFQISKNCNRKSGTWNPESGIWNLKTKNEEPRAKNQEPRTKNRNSKLETRNSKLETRNSKLETLRFALAGVLWRGMQGYKETKTRKIPGRDQLRCLLRFGL